MNSAERLQEAVKNVQGQKLIAPLAPLLEKLRTNVASFNGNEVNDGLAAAKWCRKHNLIQQGFTILQETMCSYVLLQVSGEDHYAEKNRNSVNGARKIQSENIKVNDWDQMARENQSLVKKLCEWFADNQPVSEQLKNIGNDRNDINHAGIRDSPMAAAKFGKKLDEHITVFAKYSTGG